MIEERRLVSADLMAHVDVFHRYHQTEALLHIELARVEAELAARRTQGDARIRAAVSASEGDLRRCIALNRIRLR